MEGEAVGNASAAAGTSTAIAATDTGREDSAKTNEPTCDMPTETTSGTTTDYWQPLRPKIQFSTDLRKELSSDVLEALGGGGDSSADDAKSLEEPSLDLASAFVRADMDLISQLSAPGLRPGHQYDSTATETLLRPSSATPLVEENHRCQDGADAPPTSNVSLPQSSSCSGFPETSSASPLEGIAGNGLNALAPSSATVESLSDFPSDEVSAQVSLTTSLGSMRNSPTSSAGSLVENADPLSSTVVPAASDTSDPLSSTSIVVPATEDESLVADASVELQDLPELGFAGPPLSDYALAALEASQLPMEPVSTSVTSCSVGDGDIAIIEAQQVPVKPLRSSPGPPVVSDAHLVSPATATLQLESVSYPSTAQSMDTAVAAAEFLPVALEPVPLTSGDVVTDSTLAPVELPLAETQYLTPGGMAVCEIFTVSVEDYPSASETLLSTSTVLAASDSPMTVEVSSLADASLPSAVSAPTDDAVVGSSAALISPPLPHDMLSRTTVNVPASNFSPALNSLPVQVDLSPLNNNMEFLVSSTTSSAPLVTPTVLTTVADIAPVSVTPPPIPLKVSPLDDSVSSPPLTDRFWDVPSQSPGVSLSVYFEGSRSAFRARKTSRKRRSSESGPYHKDVKGKGLSDIEKVEEVAELETMLEAQKKMLKWQIDEIQRISSLQFELTGSNPLSEEAMREVLGFNGAGKKSGDLLSPEVLQCFQEIFAIKDTLTKKEARDISFTSGASLTQVREYFASQRSLVRRLVQQAHDEAGRLGIKNASEQSQQITVLNSISEVEEDLGFAKLSGAESIEKIVEVMRAEKGFAGQIQLLQVILRTDSAALILRRFLEKGGLKILGGWLVEAATEQQTSVIYHLLKVLDHLPMSSAVSNQMKPFVQSVNNLRFHTATAVARQARLLVAKWVKLFSPKTEVKSTSSPGSKFPAGSAGKTSKLDPSGGLKRNRDPLPAQSVPGSTKKKVKAEEALPPETKASQIAGLESPRLNGMPQGASEPPPSSTQPSVTVPPPPQPRWSSTLQPSESAVAAVSVSRKRLAAKSLGDRQDRRKVLPVEDNRLGKSLGTRPATISKTSRPLSTDDVYKAKKLERLMQEEILKSKRRPVVVKGQPVAQDGVPQTGAPKKPPSQAAPSGTGTGAVRSETQSSTQGNGRGGALAAKSSQEEKPTAFRTKLPMRSPDYHDVKMAMTPTSSQDLFQSMGTPTPSPTHPGSFRGEIPKDLAYKRDSNLAGLMEIDPLSSSFWGGVSGLKRSLNMHHGVSSQSLSSVSDASGVDPAVSNDNAPNDPSHLIHSLQVSASESKDSTSAIVTSKPVEENVRMPPASSVPFESRQDELSGLDASGSKGELGIEQDLAKNSISKPPAPENSLSDFYAALRASMIRWRIPPEYQPEKQWNVTAGEDSKEREVQSGRVKREEEAYYPELSSVPDDPKDPWEEEPNYDDSLTLEIFVEGGQQKVFPEVNKSSDMSKPAVMNVVQYGPEGSLGSDVSSSTMLNPMPNRIHGQDPSAELLSKVPNVNGLDRVLQQISTAGGGGGGNHDPDLLALLLRNPELVSQLTSGHAFPPNGPANPGLFMQQLDALKQLSSGGNNGAGLNMEAGDLGQERVIPSNNSKALGIPLQPGRPVSSVDQTPPETMRVQDTITMMHHPGMGQQQTVGFVPQGGVDNRFMTPQILSGVPRNVQDTSGWEQLRVPPPPPPPSVPPTQTVINQVLHPPLPNQPNKQSNWLEPQGWVGMGRPPLNPSQTRSGHEQLHPRQTLMTQNMQLPSYGGIVGVPQVERRPETSVVSQPDAHHSQRPWSNGSHGGPPHESNMMHVNQDSGANRNNRFSRPHVRPDEHGRSGNRDFADFNNGRPTSVVDNRSAWAPNDRTRPALPQFQGVYGLPLPPPPPPPYPAPLWHGQEGSIRLVQGGPVNPFPHGRDLRTPRQQLWHNNSNPSSRQAWRGQQ